MPNTVPATATAPPPTAAARPPERTRAWLERETRLALATRTLRAQLADPDAWTDHRGRRHPVEEMSREEAGVVMRLLRRRARGLHRGAVAEYLLAPYPHREHPQVSSTPPTSSSPTPTRSLAEQDAADARPHRRASR